MFEKLLSTLPYNPSLIHQLSFYGKRMRQEASIRRLGLGFIVLAFLIQFVAVISPAQPTVADSNNDLINGGIKSAAQAASACTKNVAHYRDILKYYGISCDDVAKAPTVSLKSTAHNKQLYSAGHLPYGKAGETPVRTPLSSGGYQTIYWRYLWSWDTYAYSTYSALEVKSPVTNKTYYILYNCGNLVSIGLPTPPPTPPTPKPPKPTPTPPPTTPTPTPTPPQTPPPTPTPPTPTPPVDVCSDIPGTQTSTSECQPCEAALSSQDTIACVVESKTAANITAKIDNANDTTAHGGDILRYTLSAQNTGKATVSKFIMQENLSDVLDYAIVNDLGGGSINSNQIVAWPATDIAPGATATNTITVTVKTPIPQTPASSSDPGHFDLTMTNVYGNSVNIKLPASIIKTSQKVATTLPNTGPGTGLFISFAVTLVAGYFFARSRLLAQEVGLAIKDTNGGL